PGWDAVETPVRAHASEALSRGTVYGSLTVNREGIAPVVKINEAVLSGVLTTLRDLAGRIDAAPPTLDGILSLKGVVEVLDQDESEQERQAAEAAVIAGFRHVMTGLGDMRRREGETLGRLLLARLEEISRLAARAEAVPGRQPEAIKTRLAEQVATLLASSDRFDPDRLHQEAILLATKADIREELDRLASHVEQARKLLE